MKQIKRNKNNHAIILLLNEQKNLMEKFKCNAKCRNDAKLKLTSSIMRKIKPSTAFMNIILFNILILFFSALSISSEIPFSETFFQIWRSLFFKI